MPQSGHQKLTLSNGKGELAECGLDSVSICAAELALKGEQHSINYRACSCELLQTKQRKQINTQSWGYDCHELLHFLRHRI